MDSIEQKYPIFSPSRGGTMDFLRCPRLYDLKKRWEPWEGFNQSEAIGNALHAGMAMYYGQTTRGGIEKWMDILDAAIEALEWPEDYELRAGELSHEETISVIKKCLKEALKIDLLENTGTILAVEQEMGPEKCHPDLVIDHGVGLQVVDWKFSMHIKPEWVSQRLLSYETSWQVTGHYPWRVQQEFNLPCTKATIVQIAAFPKPIAVKMNFEITQGGIDKWYEDAVQVWSLMANGYNAHNPDGCRKYGEKYLCPLYDGCWKLNADETKFETLYRRKV